MIIAHAYALQRSFAHARAAVALAVIPLIASGCTLSEGDAWGRAEVTLQARTEFEAVRCDSPAANAATPEALPFCIRDTHLAILIDSVQLGADEHDAATAPDDALCHNGHCHKHADHEDDSHDDHEDEGAHTELPTQRFTTTPTELTDHWALIEPLDCTLGCRLPYGTLTTAQLTVHEVHLHATIEDRRREPSFESWAIDEHIALEHAITFELDEFFGRKTTRVLQLEVELTVDDHLWSELPVEELMNADEATRTALLREALLHSLDVHVHATRR